MMVFHKSTHSHRKNNYRNYLTNYRRRSKLRRPKHPMLTITTSFVNPSAELEDEAPPTYDIMDEYTNRSDKSLLIVNEHTEYTPGN